ncbi:MAG: tetratricopeptide repeat protein [Desulfobulbaceae bacterium]|nr:tetratricopeptide repeat protein [Desulfobulbaceae bacterium]HKJ15299.1 tetratricopeptide repeat protein [Desulfobulbales bacterium]MDH3775887.1 tetratricopeptide repeat protein [Desulfobulbaceae bacterium]MDH3781147.1 tetratricopeptide repeat protein [Desulfobulbaceae bacterium]MDH3921418.1 tetratricopeptide repeat protein [Desulfobulbaceae bacterium]
MNEQKENQDINEEPREAEDPARADYNKGKELRAAGDEAQAASFFHNALVGFEQNGDDQGVANASDQLGDICAARQNHEKAIAHYQRAYTICDKENDMFSLIALQKKMGAAQRALKQYDKAVNIYLNVIDIYAGYNNPAGTVNVMEELAKLYLEMGERQKSADTYRTIASIHKNFKHNIQAQEFMDKAVQVEQDAV